MGAVPDKISTWQMVQPTSRNKETGDVTPGKLALTEIPVPDLKPGEVLVEVAGCGVCHTDLSVAEGNINIPLPIVLGHEGAGIVEKTGSGVTMVKPGDHVVLTGGASCGKCRYCAMGKPILCEVFRPIIFQGILPGGQRRLHKDRPKETTRHVSPCSTQQAGWKDFPTVPPICGGDDGLPERLDGITFPKWRRESIKAYGNAIVPQVALQIFRALEDPDRRTA